jgi:multidrug efflux pump subunit AcrB
VAADLTALFEQVEGLADVDSYVQDPYDTRHFQVDTEKALRRGITVDAVIRNVRLAMGAERVSDVQRPGFWNPPIYPSHPNSWPPCPPSLGA